MRLWRWAAAAALALALPWLAVAASNQHLSFDADNGNVLLNIAFDNHYEYLTYAFPGPLCAAAGPGGSILTGLSRCGVRGTAG